MAYVQAWVYVDETQLTDRTHRSLDARIRAEAKSQYQEDGTLEIDDSAAVSRPHPLRLVDITLSIVDAHEHIPPDQILNLVGRVVTGSTAMEAINTALFEHGLEAKYIQVRNSGAD